LSSALSNVFAVCLAAATTKPRGPTVILFEIIFFRDVIFNLNFDFAHLFEAIIFKVFASLFEKFDDLTVVVGKRYLSNLYL